jgi:hypothetical protein
MNDVGEAKDELLERFDAGEEVLDLFDLEGAEYPNRESERTERLLPDLADSRPPNDTVPRLTAALQTAIKK